MFDRDADYKYSCARIIVVQLTDGETLDGGVTYVNSNKGCQVRDTHCECGIDPGTYAVFTEVDWEETCYTD